MYICNIWFSIFTYIYINYIYTYIYSFLDSLSWIYPPHPECKRGIVMFGGDRVSNHWGLGGASQVISSRIAVAPFEEKSWSMTTESPNYKKNRVKHV